MDPMRVRPNLTPTLLLRALVTGLLTGACLYLLFWLSPEVRASGWSSAVAGVFGGLSAVISSRLVKERGA